MANTTTGTLADSLPSAIDAARIVREYEGMMPNLVERHTLPKNQGLTWNEIALAQLTAQANITENTVLDNPQSITDSLFSLTPLINGIQTVVTDRTYRRIDKKTVAKMGSLAQNAMQRLKDKDGLAILDGASTSLGGAGTTLTSGHVAAAVNRVMKGDNDDEPSVGPWYVVLHQYQIKDIQDEIVSGVGTYNMDGGMTEKVFKDGFSGPMYGASVYSNNHITVDSLDDAKGGAFAKEGIVLVQGHEPRTETRRRPDLGGGAEEFYMYDEYIYGERSAGNWIVELQSDAAAPTS